MANKDAKEPEKKKDEAEESEGQEQAKPAGKKKLFIIIGAVVGLLVLGGVGMMFMGGAKEEAAEEEMAEDAEKHYQVLELDTMIVNLSESSSFLKVKLSLEYDPAVIERAMNKAHGGGGSGGEGGAGAAPPIFTERGPMLRDAIIRILSSKTSAEVLSPSGKEAMKEELLRGINEALGFEEDLIVNLYFDEFLVQ